MRRTFGWILIGLWAVAGPAYVLWQATIREPVDCCAPDGIAVGIDVFLVALFTVPVALVGLWLVNQNTDQVPSLALSVIGVFLLIAPIAIGIVVEVL